MSEIDLGSIKNGSAASDLPPEGSKKKSWADLMHVVHLAKTKPRDYQKWIRGVRFTPRGSEKKRWADLTHLAHISKLALGTIKNGSAVSDLPPEDPKKNVGLI